MECNRGNFGRNVKLARTALNLSQKDLATILNLAKTTINNIETGKESVADDILRIVYQFLGFTKRKLESSDFSIDSNYRERLIQKYGNKSQYRILLKPPGIKFAIENYLLKTNILDTPVERIVILDYFESKGWSYHPGSVSNSLSELSNFIKIEWSTVKGNTRLYSKKALK
ncbi:helix-turn-helix domain-containing protein [Mucilaginibacter agri]|uniref:Helix-turn-helix domain-containing protein n=1 Tax=Mucilaginibacter agri TaxID=2695265 RepID=A0A966DS18_9SPHI|nr:helix-turn-helix transcriptional regulator [Mucilaginibacter agri]NCD69100.1 helix-turn-helix domain-containing protein [Mucilaginibacter agri]